jgi:hypothetical protein
MSAFKDVLASIVGSTACVYTGQPFDTIKVRMQVQPGEFKSTIECFVKTLRKEGVRSFWKGSFPALTGALSENAVAFGVNGVLKRLFYKSQTDPSENRFQNYFQPFVSGAVTGSFTAVVLCPCDVVKCRAQLSRAKGLETSIREIIFTTVRTQGMAGFYTGFGAQILRDIPFYSAFFGVYAVSCDILKATTKWSDASIYFMSGG